MKKKKKDTGEERFPKFWGHKIDIRETNLGRGYIPTKWRWIWKKRKPTGSQTQGLETLGTWVGKTVRREKH